MPLARRLVIVLGAAALLAFPGCRSAQDRVVLGDDLYLQGSYARALEEYRRARRKDPEIAGIDDKISRARIQMLLQQADGLVAAARFGDARRVYDDVRRLDPSNPELDDRRDRLTRAEAEWHFQQGQRHLAAGDVFSAIPEFQQALEILPDHSRAPAALDRAVRERTERLARAQTAYEQGLDARRRGQLEEAIEQFDRARELDPHHPGAALELAGATAEFVEQNIDLGDESADRGDWAEAHEHYEIASAHDPSSSLINARIQHARRELDAEKWIDRGDHARARDDWREAYDSYEHALLLTTAPERVRDRLVEARTALVKGLAASARADEQEGRFDQALSGYQAILDLDADHADAAHWHESLAGRLRGAEALYRDGRIAQRKANLLAARKHFRDCADTLPGYRDAADRLAEVRRELDLAETLYDRALAAERIGRDDRARVLYEECLNVSRPFRDAEERLEEAVAGAWTDDGGYEPYVQGCRAQAEREYERARELLRKCRQERPGYRDVAERLDQIAELLDRAAVAYQRAEKAAREHRLEDARDAYAECVRIAGSYSAAAERLASLETSLQLLREAASLERQRRLADARDRYLTVLERHPDHPLAARRARELDEACSELQSSYARLAELEQAGDYRGALRHAVEIRKRAGHYEDVETRIARLALEADYADARSFEETGRWLLASRAYERCVERDARFRDAAARWERCRERVGRAHDPAIGPGEGWHRGRKHRSAQGRTDRD